MSQQMNVLRCFSCSMYQVHIVKKSNKWHCKICGIKQSIQAVHFQGSGSDCRKQVQHLNSLKAKNEGQQSFHSVTIDEYGLDCVLNESEIGPCDCPSRAKRSAGKWAKYLESEDKDHLDSDSSIEKENRSASSNNIKRYENRQKKRKHSYSLPPTQNSSKTNYEPIERSYSLENSSTMPNKWDKYLKDPMENSNNKTKANKSEIFDEFPIASNDSPKNHIFDDSNDDFDVDIDF